MSRPRRQQRRTETPAHQARRDRGARRDSYNLRSDCPWPALSDGTQWTAQLTRVAHALTDNAVGTMHKPEWADGEWVAVVDWDATDRFPAESARVPLAHLTSP